MARRTATGTLIRLSHMTDLSHITTIDTEISPTCLSNLTLQPIINRLHKYGLPFFSGVLIAIYLTQLIVLLIMCSKFY